MATKRSIFFAYEWTPPYQSFYKVLEQFYSKDWDIRFGADIKTLPPISGEIEKFRNKNKQLFDLFVTNIQQASVFVADVSTANPNVMLELGIAIKLNKNILVVSGRSQKDSPFNIRGLEIESYKNFDELKAKIDKYIETFLKIKNSRFEDKIRDNYFYVAKGNIESTDERIKDGQVDAGAFRITELPIPVPKIKDTKVKVGYKITEKYDAEDWFGFMFRAEVNKGGFEPVYKGAVMVNARANGNTDLTLYPGQSVPVSGQTHKSHDGLNYRPLEIVLDNETIEIKGEQGYGKLTYEKIPLVDFGHIYLVCFRCKVEYRDLEILNTDTISEIVF